MEFTLTTPGLLFPAISLLMLAYTNRFLTISSLIRSLHAQHKTAPDPLIIRQISNLRYRVRLIRDMQMLGASSFLLCVICMFLLLAGQVQIGVVLFGISLILMMCSLLLSVREIQVSIDALSLHLQDIENCL